MKYLKQKLHDNVPTWINEKSKDKAYSSHYGKTELHRDIDRVLEAIELNFIDDLYVVKSFNNEKQIKRKFYETEAGFDRNHLGMLRDSRVTYITIYRMSHFQGWVEVQKIYK